MPHTALDLPTDALATKRQLEAFLQAQLSAPELASHPLAAAKSKASYDQLKTELAQTDNAPNAPGKNPPKQGRYVDAALVSANEKSTKDYFTALDAYAKSVCDSESLQAQATAQTAMLVKKAEVIATETAYDLAMQRYESALKQYEADKTDFPERADDYVKQMRHLRWMTKTVINEFNKHARADEQIENDLDVAHFRKNYQIYEPTESWWNNAAGGTLFYDFVRNSMQLHIHCDANAAANIKAVRVKRYGQEHGVNANGDNDLCTHFKAGYAPSWTGRHARY